MPLATKVDQTAADGKKKQAAAPHAYSRRRNQTAAGHKKDQAAADGQKKWAAAPHTSSCGGGVVEVAAGHEGVPDGRGRQAQKLMPPRPARSRTGFWKVVPDHGEGGRATADKLKEETPRQARFRTGTQGGPRP